MRRTTFVLAAWALGLGWVAAESPPRATSKSTAACVDTVESPCDAGQQPAKSQTPAPSPAVEADGGASDSPKIDDAAHIETGEPAPSAPESLSCGLTCRPIPEVLAAHLPKLLSAHQGLWIQEVLADSLAARYGLQPHDLLLSVDRCPIGSVEELERACTAQTPSELRTLRIIRAGRPLTLTFVCDGGSAAEPPLLPLPNHPLALALSVERLCLALSSTDGQHYRAEIRQLAADHVWRKHTLQGTREAIARQLSRLPAEVVREIQEQLAPDEPNTDSGKATD